MIQYMNKNLFIIIIIIWFYTTRMQEFSAVPGRLDLKAWNGLLKTNLPLKIQYYKILFLYNLYVYLYSYNEVYRYFSVHLNGFSEIKNFKKYYKLKI